MTDGQILTRLQRGDQEALELLMDKYRRYVYTIAANILGGAGSQADAEEAAMDAFYAVWSHARDIGRGKLKPYLCATARNKAKDKLRTLRELPMDLDAIELPDGGDTLDQGLMERELQRQVRRAVHRMRPKDREIFLRYYYYFQTTDQIAAAMGIPAGTVRTRLVRGRKKLKDALEELS